MTSIDPTTSPTSGFAPSGDVELWYEQRGTAPTSC